MFPLSDAKPKRSFDRSPNYPAIPLEEAVRRAAKVWETERKNWANVAVVAKHWSYSAKSSGVREILAAMNQYGLLEFRGDGEDRSCKLTERALRIQLKADGHEQALREAALAPAIHQHLWETYGEGGFPSDANLKNYLIMKKNFNANSVDKFIECFKATLAFTNMEAGAMMASKPSNKPPAIEGAEPDVGDEVEWTINGQAMFGTPRRVLSKEPGFLFVEGTSTGVPVQQATLIRKAAPKGTSQMPTESPVPTTNNGTPPLAPELRASLRDLTLPLIGNLAVLRVPVPMSLENFDLLTNLLAAMKPALVSDPKIT